MVTISPRLLLKRPQGSDRFDTSHLQDNVDLLDAAPGVHVCTSSTRPGMWTGAQAGRLIYETDTRQFWAWNGSTWLVPKFQDLSVRSLNTDSTVRSAFFKTTSPTEHSVTIYQASPTGVDTGVALNVICDNAESSAMYLSGTEKNRGTLKIAHRGYADGSDNSASALSIDLQHVGSLAQGIYIFSSDTNIGGNAITVRNNGRDDFVIKSTGRVGIGLAIAATPGGRLEIAQNDDTTPGLVVKANSTIASDLIQFKRSSDGAVRTRVDPQCQLVTLQIAFFNGAGIQIGSTTVDFGGGSGVISLKNATTVPVSNPTGGGILYAEGGALKWRGSNGTITTIAPA